MAERILRIFPQRIIAKTVVQHLRKVLKILLIIASIGALFFIGFLILGIIAVQDKYDPKQFKNKIEIVESEQTESTINTNLIEFLENPIDLQGFKSKKNQYVTTTVINGMDYYFNPKFRDSIFYSYNFIVNDIGKRGINELIVFKYGENQHRYDDETENLIEMKIFNKDSKLKKANLIGYSKKELELEFGNDYLTFENRIIYSNKNKILIFEMDSSKVKTYRYIKLNTEKIDNDLIGEIIK